MLTGFEWNRSAVDGQWAFVEWVISRVYLTGRYISG